MEQTLQGLKAKQAKLYSLFEEDGTDKDLLLSRLNELKEQYDRLASRRSKLSHELNGHATGPVPFPVVKAVMTQFVRDSSPPEQRKALVHLLMRRITVDKGKISRIELQIDERIQQSFLREGPSGEPEGPFDCKGVFPLTFVL